MSKAQLGYPFAPVPHRALAAVATGALTETDFVILSFLYDRAEYRSLADGGTPRLRLGQIAEGVNWRGTSDGLSKRLRRLRARPDRWIDWKLQRGKGGDAVYAFTLFPHEASEVCPTFEGRTTSERMRSPHESGSPTASYLASDIAAVESQRHGDDGPCGSGGGPMSVPSANPFEAAFATTPPPAVSELSRPLRELLALKDEAL